MRGGARGLALGWLLAGLIGAPMAAETKTIALDSAGGLKLRNVAAEPVVFKGRKAVRVTDSAPKLGDGERIAIVTATELEDGVIEIELAGDVAPNAPEDARGFTGVAFRAAADGSRYECFYLRPLNGRAEDQVRRNHSAQYMSLPGFPWSRLRKEFPEKYETYVDLVPGEWTKVKIEVRGEKARLYVHDAPQPVLVVNDLKQRAGKGAIGLWVGVGTVAHFANLRITQ